MTEVDLIKLSMVLIWILLIAAALTVAILPEVQKHLARNKLKTIIAKSLEKDIDLDFNDFKLLASSNNLSRYELLRVMQKELSDGYEKADTDRIALIKSYLSIQKTEEPYENIPADIKINLEHIKAKLGDDGVATISPLVSTLQKYGIKERRSKILTWVFGVFSFIATIAGLFLSLKSA